jgi:putative ABC transport system substrate-binding protein
MPALTPERARYLEAFRQGLHDLGWVEGQNLAIEYRHAEGGAEQYPHLAADLVRLQVDVILSMGGSVRAAKEATSTIPIVMGANSDPVRPGLVASLAQPGGNITGFGGFGEALSGKRLEFLKETVPQNARIAVLKYPASSNTLLRETQVTAQALGVELHILEVRSADEFESAFTAMERAGVGALLLLSDPFILENHPRDITALALKYRLPTMYPWRLYVDAGGLMSYGVSLREIYRRSATFVDKILKGAKPADLPMEQPTKFELVINLKTAKALGLTMPPALLLLADEVIQ